MYFDLSSVVVWCVCALVVWCFVCVCLVLRFSACLIFRSLPPFPIVPFFGQGVFEFTNMKRVKASGYRYMQNKAQKGHEEMIGMKQEIERLKKLLEESQNCQHDLESDLNKSKGQVYTLEADLFLAHCAAEDLREEVFKIGNDNDRLKEEQVTANDVMRRAAIRRKRVLAEEKKQKRETMRSVLAAFNWKKETADPLLLEAACALWNALGERDESVEYCEGQQRVSCLARKIAWKKITLEGWNGDMEKQLEKEFILKKRLSALSLTKTSDMESKFNVKVTTDISKCDPKHQKYDRTMLPSDRTCRRIMQRVYDEAEKLGFSSFPVEQEGNVWCWGDESGNFTNGVNRYVYETYFKPHPTLSTEEAPWIIPVTGDLARVSFRGKSITMCGVKQADSRLPSQLLTGKSMNQSRNLYTPAVAGFTDEKKMMPYFEELVAAFVEIEKRGYCVVDGVEYPIHIRCVVVADMAFLHKYLGRGGGSSKTICFCFLCSSKCHYRNRGYPGGCLKCRRLQCVYDEDTGVQKCLHHDVCTPDFLHWEKQRFEELEAKVKPKIPLMKLPPWESVPALRLECIKRCVNDEEVAELKRMNNETKLQRWLLSRCKRKYMSCMCCKCI